MSEAKKLIATGLFWLLVILISIILTVAAGCSSARQGMMDLSAENVKNAETMKEIALDCVSIWPVQSGFIYGALDKKLSVETTEALKELDLLAENTELTDYQLGYFLGLKTRLLSSVIQVALEKYAPSIVEYLF